MSSKSVPPLSGVDAGDNSAVKIAAGVTVPLVVLVLIGIGIAVYRLYRKKYPVRMILGRDFGKFSNPDYRPPATPHTLVREDADQFFHQNQLQPGGRKDLSLIIDGRGGSAYYENTAFEFDSGEGDEEEVEKRFREKKGYLFKKNEENVDGTEIEVDETPSAPKRGKRGKGKGHAGEKRGEDNAGFVSEASDDGDEARSKMMPRNKSASSSEGLATDTTDNDSDDARSSPVPHPRYKRRPLPTAPAEDESSTEEPPKQEVEYHAGMTVKQFLQLIKSKQARTLSDLDQERANSISQYDAKMSARRRAQSVDTCLSPSAASRLTDKFNANVTVLRVSSDAARYEGRVQRRKMHESGAVTDGEIPQRKSSSEEESEETQDEDDGRSGDGTSQDSRTSEQPEEPSHEEQDTADEIPKVSSKTTSEVKADESDNERNSDIDSISGRDSPSEMYENYTISSKAQLGRGDGSMSNLLTYNTSNGPDKEEHTEEKPKVKGGDSDSERNSDESVSDLELYENYSVMKQVQRGHGDRSMSSLVADNKADGPSEQTVDSDLDVSGPADDENTVITENAKPHEAAKLPNDGIHPSFEEDDDNLKGRETAAHDVYENQAFNTNSAAAKDKDNERDDEISDASVEEDRDYANVRGLTLEDIPSYNNYLDDGGAGVTEKASDAREAPARRVSMEDDSFVVLSRNGHRSDRSDSASSNSDSFPDPPSLPDTPPRVPDTPPPETPPSETPPPPFPQDPHADAESDRFSIKTNSSFSSAHSGKLSEDNASLSDEDTAFNASLSERGKPRNIPAQPDDEDVSSDSDSDSSPATASWSPADAERETARKVQIIPRVHLSDVSSDYSSTKGSDAESDNDSATDGNRVRFTGTLTPGAASRDSPLQFQLDQTPPPSRRQEASGARNDSGHAPIKFLKLGAAEQAVSTNADEPTPRLRGLAALQKLPASPRAPDSDNDSENDAESEPPPRPSGLAALRKLPVSTSNPDETDSDEDIQLTDDDIEAALSSAASESDDDQRGSKVKVKFDPANTYVFDEDNEDIDV